MGTITVVMKADTWSLDYSPYTQRDDNKKSKQSSTTETSTGPGFSSSSFSSSGLRVESLGCWL